MNRMGGVWKDGVALVVLPLKSKTSLCQRWLERQRWSQKRPEGREKEDDKGLEGKTKQNRKQCRRLTKSRILFCGVQS